ncbi:KAP family P-loop NTPase fold protein [Corynebacterium aquilae]|uniref:KAP NTPase domain-containing protein n=1 Tax=Corynebacterium aquilae DSM 44791 TaxID=1431546 RepID=A0A1L7CHD3_9CORY|nr:P-loop NTPase fold protein [Corynebacterium aquilae]APT85272.1 hypothetical protein CAQU_09545 [Corynebacterium aquilae DSM 44791]
MFGRKAAAVLSATDNPVGQGNNHDLLNLGNYATGLAAFMRGCETPMTVAIQGDWGSGKTSLMNMVRELLDSGETQPPNQRPETPAAVKTMFFNTWQYSQFDMGDNLILALISQFIDHISPETPGAQQGQKLKKTLAKIARTLGVGVATEAASVIPLLPLLVKAVDGGIDAYANTLSSEELSEQARSELQGNTKILSELREELRELVATSLAGRYERLVVFIDDLDRLEPARAVELMEALKLFLDVENCVFVLAIDFEVVKQGVKAKYGSEFDDRKAQAFFDKIIQVPFHVPVNAYEISSLLKGMLEGILVDSSQDIDPHLIDAIRYSIGNNPRSLKRLVNTFGLLTIIDDQHTDTNQATTQRKECLLAALCMQSAYPRYYQHFNRRLMSLGDPQDAPEFASFIHADINFDEDDSEKHLDKLSEWGIRGEDAEQFELFLQNFAEIFTGEGEKSNQAAAFEQLRASMHISAITAVGNSHSKPDVTWNYGLDAVAGVLRDKHAISSERIDWFEQLYGAVNEGEQRVATSIGRQAEAKFKVSLPGGEEGTLVSQIRFQATATQVSMVKNNLALRDELEQLLRAAGFTDSELTIGEGKSGNFMIAVRQMTPENTPPTSTRFAALVECLQKAHEVLA